MSTTEVSQNGLDFLRKGRTIWAASGCCEAPSPERRKEVRTIRKGAFFWRAWRRS